MPSWKGSCRRSWHCGRGDKTQAEALQAESGSSRRQAVLQVFREVEAGRAPLRPLDEQIVRQRQVQAVALRATNSAHTAPGRRYRLSACGRCGTNASVASTHATAGRGSTEASFPRLTPCSPRRCVACRRVAGTRPHRHSCGLAPLDGTVPRYGACRANPMCRPALRAPECRALLSRLPRLPPPAARALGLCRLRASYPLDMGNGRPRAWRGPGSAALPLAGEA